MNASSSRSHAIFTIHVQQRRIVPAAAASPAPSGDSGQALQRKDSSHAAREADQVEELVEAHMVFVDLAGLHFAVMQQSCVIVNYSSIYASICPKACLLGTIATLLLYFFIY